MGSASTSGSHADAKAKARDEADTTGLTYIQKEVRKGTIQRVSGVSSPNKEMLVGLNQGAENQHDMLSELMNRHKKIDISVTSKNLLGEALSPVRKLARDKVGTPRRLIASRGGSRGGQTDTDISIDVIAEGSGVGSANQTIAFEHAIGEAATEEEDEERQRQRLDRSVQWHQWDVDREERGSRMHTQVEGQRELEQKVRRITRWEKGTMAQKEEWERKMKIEEWKKRKSSTPNTKVPRDATKEWVQERGETKEQPQWRSAPVSAPEQQSDAGSEVRDASPAAAFFFDRAAACLDDDDSDESDGEGDFDRDHVAGRAERHPNDDLHDIITRLLAGGPDAAVHAAVHAAVPTSAPAVHAPDLAAVASNAHADETRRSGKTNDEDEGRGRSKGGDKDRGGDRERSRESERPFTRSLPPRTPVSFPESAKVPVTAATMTSGIAGSGIAGLSPIPLIAARLPTDSALVEAPFETYRDLTLVSTNAFPLVPEDAFLLEPPHTPANNQPASPRARAINRGSGNRGGGAEGSGAESHRSSLGIKGLLQNRANQLLGSRQRPPTPLKSHASPLGGASLIRGV
jgi:hypothetical protein